jgi:putative flavoprotein involved in K+ transport
MRRIDTLVIGGGHAGLAMSRCLHDRGIEHVVLERGRVAERWRSERWDSLRLLTPNWLTRLPGYRYTGPDPDGFMTMPELIDYFEGFARTWAAPIESGTTVVAVEPRESGFRVSTDRGDWHADHVVIATGYSDLPAVPPAAAALSSDIVQVVPTRYRHPGQLPEGGVLVVGASATGLQLADEIHASGRAVTLAVGRHMRLRRRYRGRDVLWWLDAMGIFDETTDDVYDLEISRRQPSLQLVGRPDHATLDLPMLERAGVRLVGRLAGIERRMAFFEDDLVAHTAAADVRLAQLLARIDQYVVSNGLAHHVDAPEPFEPFCWPRTAPSSVDLHAEGIRSVVWATGFRREYSWLRVPVLDGHREIVHRHGVTPVAGLYVLGLHFQRRRKSAFIDGAGDDARVLADHLVARRAAVL